MMDLARSAGSRYLSLASAVEVDERSNLVLRNGSTPTTLVHHDRCWTLELYELARVDDSVYRPRRRRIDGRLAILAYLKAQDPQGLLGRVTERLMVRHTAVACAFDSVNGGWLAQGTRARVASAQALPETEPALSESATVR